MTSKERAALRGAANGLETVYRIGKGEIDETLLRGVSEALKARELIKVQVQEQSSFTAREAADIIAKNLEADVVQVIGGRFVLYKRNPKINQYGVK